MEPRKPAVAQAQVKDPGLRGRSLIQIYIKNLEKLNIQIQLITDITISHILNRL